MLLNLKLYSTCILYQPFYTDLNAGQSIIKADARRIDAVDQWCLRTLLGIPSENWKRPRARASWHHVAEHRPARSESLRPHTEQSSRPGQNRSLWRLMSTLALRTPSGACQKIRRKRNLNCV